MRRVDEYKRFAEDYRKLARSLRKPEHRQQLEYMTTAWEMLALEREARLPKQRKDSGHAA